MTGTRLVKAMTKPQSTPGNPTIMKASPPRTPWTIATTPLPRTADLMISTKVRERMPRCLSVSGASPQAHSANAAPSSRMKNSEKSTTANVPTAASTFEATAVPKATP